MITDGNEIYIGEFKNDIIHGFGEYIYPDGTKY
jgi:hypothetical protein